MFIVFFPALGSAGLLVFGSIFSLRTTMWTRDLLVKEVGVA